MNKVFYSIFSSLASSFRLFYGFFFFLSMLFLGCLSTNALLPRETLVSEYLSLAQYYLPKDKQKTFDLYSRILQLDPTLSTIRYNLIQLSIELEEKGRAIREIQIFLKQEPENILVQKIYAYLLFEQNRPREALNLYERILAINPLDKDVLFNLGVYFLKKKDYARARKNLEDYIKTYPLEINAVKALYELEKEENTSLKKQIEYLEYIIIKDKKRFFFITLTDLYLKEKNYPQALETLDKAINAQSLPLEKAVLHFEKGYINLSQKDIKSALEEFEKAFNFNLKALDGPRKKEIEGRLRALDPSQKQRISSVFKENSFNF